MTHKIFNAILSVAIAVLLANLLLITGVLYAYFGSIQEEQLKDSLHFAARGVEQSGSAYLQNLPSDPYRLTWIAATGTVLFDNQVDIHTMENHVSRKEVQEALLGGSGSDIRYSGTLTRQTVYEALRLSDGTVLRISISRATAAALLLGMLQPILLIALSAIALSAYLAYRMAKAIVEPLNRLNLDKPSENAVYEELSPLLHRIHAQRMEIQRQIQNLKQKQDEFRHITANMREALVLLDNKDKILSLNPAAVKLFSADLSCLGEDFLTLDRSQGMRLALAKAKEQGQAKFRSEIHGRIYRFTVSPIASEGHIQGLVILAFDITEQAEAEQMRQEFSANVSHELKTPLQSIIGSAELIEHAMVKAEDLPRFGSHIHKEAKRLLTLIEDIIRLSQLEEGVPMPREELSLYRLAEEVCETLADAAKKKNIRLRIQGGQGKMSGVRKLLFTLIYNLCDNAIMYNKEQGQVDICIQEDKELIRLTVKDTGIGIAPEHTSRVFERFYRVDKSHSKQSGGTGLGLSIVKHCALLHGAKLHLESEPDKGTSITVTFMRAEG